MEIFHIDFVSLILKKNRCNGGNEVVNQFPELLGIGSNDQLWKAAWQANEAA